MKNKLFKMISLFMAIVLLITIIPMGIYAADTEESKESQVSEDEEARDIYSKTYETSMGTNVVISSAVPMHYEKDGEFVEIDNTLVKSEKDKSILTNKSNAYSVELPSRYTSDSQISIEYEGNILSFKVVDETIKSSKGTLISSQEREIDDTDVKSIAYSESNIEKLSSSINYKDVAKGVDYQYTISNGQLKEGIILEAVPEKDFSISYELNIGDLSAKLNKDNSVTIFDKNNKEIYKIESPYMFDEKRNTTDEIKTTLDSTDKSYLLTYTPNYDWLANSNISYPVTIDPTITITGIESNNSNQAMIFDTYVSDYSGNSNYSSEENVCIQNNDDEVCYGFYYFDSLPSIPFGSKIINASLNLSLIYDSDNYDDNTEQSFNDVSVHQVQTSNNYVFDIDDVVWNDMNSLVINSAGDVDNVDSIIDDGNDNVYNFEITDIVNNWYSDEQTLRCLYLQCLNEDRYPINIASSDSLESDLLPYLVIEYRNDNGISDDKIYHTQDCGLAGTIYVDDYSGNLVVERDDLVSNGFAGALTFYTGKNCNIPSNSFLGENMSFNYYKTLETDTTNDENEYIITNGDGSIVYTEELNNIETSVNNNEITVEYTDDEDSQITETYTNSSAVSGINNNGNLYILKSHSEKSKNATNSKTISITYRNSHIQSLTDEISSYEFFYSKQKLSRIKKKPIQSEPNETLPELNYYYSTETNNENNLYNRVNYFNNATPTYQTYIYYDSLGRISKIQDENGKYYTYQYYNNNKVSTVQEYSAPENGVSTPGEYLHFVYGSNYTTITDGTDSNTEYFDNEGKLFSVIDDEGNAVFAQYKDGLVSKVSKTRNSARNINNFYNFESDSDCFFDSLSGTVNITNTEHFNGNSSVELSSPAGSNVIYENEITGLKDNTTYTVSMWIKTADSSHLSLKLSNDDSNGIFQTVSANSDYSNWERITCTMSTGESNCLVVTIKDNRSRCSANTVYVDNMYVQQSTEPTSVNLLSNNDFNEATSGWILSDSSSSIVSESANISTADEYRIKLLGDYTSTNNINQTIQLDSNNYQNTKFTFGGWIRVVDAIPVKEGSQRNISIKLEALKSDGTTEFSKSIPISPNNSVWQYFEDEITILSNNITSLKYSINYNCEMGYLLADGLSLSQEELYNIKFNYDLNQNISSIIVENKTVFDENQNNTNNLELSTNYHYDDYGNIDRVIDSASVDNISQSIVSAQTYSNNGSLLTKMTNNIGYNTSYSYDRLGNLTQVTDANGNTIEYQFDNLQNISGIINEFKLSSDANADASTLKIKYIYSGNTLEEIQTGTVVNNAFSAVNTYSFSYDKWNNLESVYVNDNTTPFILYEYDSDKYWQLNSVSYINGQEIHYLYDDDGNIIYEHDSGDTNGDTLSYSYYYYDNGVCYGKKDYILERIETYQDELTTISDFDGNVIHSYGKDLSGNILEQINDNYIHISETTDNDDQTNLSTSSQTTTINDVESNISIITDAFGRKQTEVITIDNNSSIVKNYEYYDSNDSYESDRNQFAEDTDAIKSVSYIKSVNGVTTPLYTYEYTYDKNGNVHSEKVTKGTDTQNAVTQTHTYNSANMLLSSMSSDNDKRLKYEYDSLGNMTYMQRKYMNGADEDWVNVSYSSLESETGTKIGNVVKEFPYEDDKITVSHDSLGNVTSLEHIILHENVFAPCDDATYYELDWTRGNVLNGISSEYKTSDGQNTTSVPRSSISYKYDDNNLRTKKIFNMADDMNYVTNGNNNVLNGYTDYYWREGLLVAEHSEFSGTNMQEYDSINNTTIDNSGEYETTVLYDKNNNAYGFILTKIERDNQNVITNETSEIYYYIKDANNTITSITDESGNTVLSYDYNMYGDFSGNYRAATGYKYLAIVSPLTYRDYIYDYESGLYYLQSRYYAPFVGRFISADNVLDTCSGTSMSTNLYSYCENDPINNIDLSGFAYISNQSLRNGLKGLLIGIGLNPISGVAIVCLHIALKTLKNYIIAKATIVAAKLGALVNVAVALISGALALAISGFSATTIARALIEGKGINIGWSRTKKGHIYGVSITVR